MIDLQYVKSFYPDYLANNKVYDKHIVKEFVELMGLEYLSNTEYIRKLAFIGGTNLRLVKGIDRFSEDIDFDCKNMNEAEFIEMTDKLITFFRNNGLDAEAHDKKNTKLVAFRRSIYFPQLLFDLGLTAHCEQRFLLKVETQDQGIPYETQISQISRNGFVFQVPTPPDNVLLSMKLSALLSRGKGRDFYDTMFLWQITQPDFTFLKKHENINGQKELFEALETTIANLDLEMKSKDFEHLLFNPNKSKTILQFPRFLEMMKKDNSQR